MNRYMSELAQMIPACNAVPRRLDKLSILKMTVDHMKALRGDPHSASDYKPGFLTDDELKKMLVQVCTCVRVYGGVGGRGGRGRKAGLWKSAGGVEGDSW